MFTRGGEPGFHPLDARLQLEQAGRDGDASRPARQHSDSSGVSSERLEKMFQGWRQEESFLRAFASGIAPELFLGSSRHPLQMLLGATDTDRWLWPPAGQVPLVVRWALHDTKRRTWVIAPRIPGAWWMPFVRTHPGMITSFAHGAPKSLLAQCSWRGPHISRLVLACVCPSGLTMPLEPRWLPPRTITSGTAES